MTQPILSRAELVSSLDFSHEKNVINENFPLAFRANLTSNKLTYHQSDLRHKQLRLNPSRLPTDCSPVRQTSRSRVNDRLPSPKGKKITIFFLYFFY
jgi:hypothetical protein